jgi:hypothetical protein
MCDAVNQIRPADQPEELLENIWSGSDDVFNRNGPPS